MIMDMISSMDRQLEGQLHSYCWSSNSAGLKLTFDPHTIVQIW